MPSKPLRPCNKPGCPALVSNGYCPEHEKQRVQRYDKQRGSAHERGYNYRWQQYSKAFLRQVDNLFCKLQLNGCTNLSQCVDHIDPPSGPDDPRFWDASNHQAACIRCNSIKGHRLIKGEARPFGIGRGTSNL